MSEPMTDERLAEIKAEVAAYDDRPDQCYMFMGAVRQLIAEVERLRQIPQCPHYYPPGTPEIGGLAVCKLEAEVERLRTKAQTTMLGVDVIDEMRKARL